MNTLRPPALSLLTRAGICCLVLLAGFCDAGSRLAEGVTKQGLLELRPGLSRDQVTDLIGEPLTEERDSHAETAGADGKSEDGVVLIYAEPGFLQGGFEMWVVMEEGRVAKAGVEEYDLAIYRCNRDECPVIWDEDALDRLDSPGFWVLR